MFDVLARLRGMALDAGDVALAKMTHRWEGELLGDAETRPAAVPTAEVVDLGERRAERVLERLEGVLKAEQAADVDDGEEQA